MRVRVTVVGQDWPRPEVEWPDGWPVPREGEAVGLPDVTGRPLVVRTVAWYPHGEDDDPEPFVYVVVGNPRPW